MRLNEIYGQQDSDTTPEDMVITRYELGQLTYDEAMAELKRSCNANELAFWEMELIAAQANQEPIQPPSSKRVH